MSYVRYNPSAVVLTGVAQTGTAVYTNVTRPLLYSPTRSIQAVCDNIPTNVLVTINWYGSNFASEETLASVGIGGVLFAQTLLGGATWTAGMDSSGAVVTSPWRYIYATVTVASAGTVTNLRLTVGV